VVTVLRFSHSNPLHRAAGSCCPLKDDESLAVTTKLCVSIFKLLEEAKHNKKECGSLKRLVETIRAFLQSLEAEAVSNAGKEALGRSRVLLLAAIYACS